MTRKSATVFICAVLLGGCSSVNVVKNPSPSDNGIRFYRPKPYLLVTPADPTGRMVKLEVLQLPDYCEEYSIHPRGKKPPGVQLQDGWNLVGVGGSGGPPPPAPAAPPPPPADPLKLPEAVLVAGNVPIGLYESVFDYGGPVKFLKGWRYVGFSPWGGGLPNGTDAAALANVRNGCPACVSPNSVLQGPLYGIVFFNGAMTFRQIDEIANNMTCPEYVKPFNPPAPTSGGVRTEPAAPTPGGVAVPRESAPPAPSSNPGSAWLQGPRPGALPRDVGVKQASAAASRPAAVTPPARRPAASRAKVVDQKALEGLEAEVFRSLDVTPAADPPRGGPAPPVGDPIVPELSPATPGK